MRSLFFMGNAEDTIFAKLPNIKPSLFSRHVDDIFLEIKDKQHIKDIIHKFQNSSVLKFTCEMNAQNKLPFLDILIEHKEEQYHTTVYKKPTNARL